MKPEVSVPWYRSVTMWIGLLAVAVAALQEFAGVFPNTVAADKALAIAGVLTILLRLTNSKPIQGTPKEAKRTDEVAAIAEQAVKQVVLQPQDPGAAGKMAVERTRSAIAAEVAEAVQKTIKRT